MGEYQILLDVIREHFAGVVWTHKVQEKQSDIYGDTYKILKLCNIVVAALTSCGIISIIFTDSYLLDIATALLSFFSIALSAFFQSFDLNAMQKQHKDAANQFITIRNELLGLITDTHMQEKSVTDISNKLEEIVIRLNTAYLSAPTTSNRAVTLASEALNIKNEYSYTDEEIDHFLPPHLKGPIKEKK